MVISKGVISELNDSEEQKGNIIQNKAYSVWSTVIDLHSKAWGQEKYTRVSGNSSELPDNLLSFNYFFQSFSIQSKWICLHFAGQALKVSAEAFTSDPCYLPKRQAVVQAARSLLTAVTRLLILADMVDVAYLLEHLTVVSRSWLN